MAPEIDSLASGSGAHWAACEGARASRTSKPMTMPITTPIEAGRTHAS